MKSSLKEVTDSIESIVNNKMTEFLKGVKYLSSIQFEAKTYPYLFYFVEQSATIQQRANLIPITLRFLDVAEGVNEKQERDLEIKSDMIQTASILLDWLQKDKVLEADIDNTYTPIYVKYGDGLSGIELTVNIPIIKPCVIDG